MTKKLYDVYVPLAGYAIVTVEATSEREAIEVGLDTATLDDLEEWTTLERYQKGNVCYCPTPWKAEAVLIDEQDEEN